MIIEWSLTPRFYYMLEGIFPWNVGAIVSIRLIYFLIPKPGLSKVKREHNLGIMQTSYKLCEKAIPTTLAKPVSIEVSALGEMQDDYTLGKSEDKYNLGKSQDKYKLGKSKDEYTLGGNI